MIQSPQDRSASRRNEPTAVTLLAMPFNRVLEWIEIHGPFGRRDRIQPVVLY
jgi:hypothetical protein